jgi:hypothetical protein
MTRRLRIHLRAFVLLIVTLFQLRAAAFPGVFVGKGNRPRVAHAAHVVVLLNGPLAVVTVLSDYEGPIEPFSLVLPVASDVTLDRVRAVKREFIARLEQLSAPRFHAFYEMDPCDPNELEQDWDVKYKATEPGFLAPSFMPPPELNWTVPNEISIPTEPVFKKTESEFSFRMLPTPTRRQLNAWATLRGYNIESEMTQALLQTQRPLLIAEVNARARGIDR